MMNKTFDLGGQQNTTIFSQGQQNMPQHRAPKGPGSSFDANEPYSGVNVIRQNKQQNPINWASSAPNKADAYDNRPVG